MKSHKQTRRMNRLKQLESARTNRVKLKITQEGGDEERCQSDFHNYRRSHSRLHAPQRRFQIEMLKAYL